MNYIEFQVIVSGEQKTVPSILAERPHHIQGKAAAVELCRVYTYISA